MRFPKFTGLEVWTPVKVDSIEDKVRVSEELTAATAEVIAQDLCSDTL
jgi:hypothetical protein